MKYKLRYDPKVIYDNTLLAMSAHIAALPQMCMDDYSHCWDRNTFCFQSFDNTDGAFCFGSGKMIGALRKHVSPRMQAYPKACADDYFVEAPPVIRNQAKEDVLRYLRMSYPRKKAYIFYKPSELVIPVVTTVCWGEGGNLYSCDKQEEFVNHGGMFLEFLSKNPGDVQEFLAEDYGLGEKELEFALMLQKAKKCGSNVISKIAVRPLLEAAGDMRDSFLQALSDFGIGVE